ncbi:MFS transporter [Diplocloster hominis]|uniref:MFS transporter n=1 Tax=Diplocloster hominis TaxID=3079010 RepID=UPI0031BB5F69
MKNKLLNRYFILVWVGAVCLLLIQNTMCTAIPLFLNEQGFSTTFSGMLGIPFAIMGVAARMAGGYLMDRFGRRLVMIGGCLLMGIASFFFQLFPIAVCMLIFRGLHGAGFAFGQAAFSTANVDVTPEDKRSLGIGVFWMSTALALASTGYLIQIFGRDGDYSRIFIVCLVLGILGAVISFCCDYEKKRAAVQVQRPAAEAKKNWRSFLEPTAARPAVIEFFVMLGAACCNIFILTFAAEQGYVHAGTFLLVSAAAMAISNLSADVLVNRFGAKKILGITMGVSGILTILITWIPCPFTYYLGGIGFGMTQGFSFPVLTILTMSSVTHNRRGTANSTMLLAGDVGMGVGTFLWGAAIDKVSYAAAFACAGGCIILGGVLCFLLYRSAAGEA